MKNQQLRAAVYVRVSTEEQATEGFSIQAQLSELYRYAELSGYEVIGEYIDEGVSGKSIEGRPMMKKLLFHARQNKFNAVLVYKLDRISRKTKDALEISEELECNNVKLISKQENFDTTTPMGKMVFQVISSFAELERNTIVDRVKMGMTERAKQGKFNGGQCLGYDSVNKHLVINDSEAIIVREICDMAERGLGLKAIARRVNDKDYKTKKGQLFSVISVKTILENPIYIGKIRFNQVENWNEKRRKGNNNDYILVDGEQEPIITIEQWEKVQHIRKNRSVKTARSHEPYILSGLLKCPACGHGMVPNRSKGATGLTYRYYVCGQNHNKGKKACSAHSIRADVAVQHVVSEMQRIVTEPHLLREIIADVNKERKQSDIPQKEEIRLLNSKVNKLSSHIDKLMNALLEGDLPQEIVKPKLISSQEEKQQIEQRLEQLHNQLSAADTSPVDFDSLYRLLTDMQTFLSKLEPEEHTPDSHSQYRNNKRRPTWCRTPSNKSEFTL